MGRFQLELIYLYFPPEIGKLIIGNRPLGRPRRRWEDDIRMDLKEMSINTRNWADSAHDRHYLRTLENSAEPPGSITYGVSYRKG